MWLGSSLRSRPAVAGSPKMTRANPGSLWDNVAIIGQGSSREPGLPSSHGAPPVHRIHGGRL
jgi:hypothetical protein